MGLNRSHGTIPFIITKTKKTTSIPYSTQGGDAPTDENDINAEVEPFYALAQRCRLSGAPDMVLEVLNAYRAMASPGALRAGAPRYVFIHV